MESSQHLARLGAVAALIGTVVLVVSTFLHPLDADPNDARAAFAEYAADPLWVWSHLGQFIGVALLGAALVGLAATFRNGRSAALAHLGIVGTAATIATAAVLQAVDGVALNVMVDRWAGILTPKAAPLRNASNAGASPVARRTFNGIDPFRSCAAIRRPV